MIQYVRGERGWSACRRNEPTWIGFQHAFCNLWSTVAIITAGKRTSSAALRAHTRSSWAPHATGVPGEATSNPSQVVHDVALLVLWRTAGLSHGLPQVSTCKGTAMSEPAPIHTGNRGVGVWCGSEVW